MEESAIQTYVMLLKHEMLAEYIRTVDKKFIEQIILRAGGKLSEVDEVLNHPSISKTENGKYTVKGLSL